MSRAAPKRKELLSFLQKQADAAEAAVAATMSDVKMATPALAKRVERQATEILLPKARSVVGPEESLVHPNMPIVCALIG